MGGSILPITVHKGRVCLLFGKERDLDENPGWSDFGGGSEKGESLLQTAVREGSEELTGFLGDQHDIRKLLKRHGTYIVDYHPEQKQYSTYRVHVFPLPYDAALPAYYNNNQAFLQKRLDPKIIRDTKVFEKTQIRWMSFSEIRKMYAGKKFRAFYQNVVRQLLEHQAELETFVKKALAHRSLPRPITTTTRRRGRHRHRQTRRQR